MAKMGAKYIGLLHIVLRLCLAMRYSVQPLLSGSDRLNKQSMPSNQKNQGFLGVTCKGLMGKKVWHLTEVYILIKTSGDPCALQDGLPPTSPIQHSLLFPQALPFKSLVGCKVVTIGSIFHQSYSQSSVLPLLCHQQLHLDPVCTSIECPWACPSSQRKTPWKFTHTRRINMLYKVSWEWNGDVHNCTMYSNAIQFKAFE